MMKHNRDPHHILGLQRDATREQIRAAYRRLAKQFHPDVNPIDPDAEEKFKEIQWAYEEISAPNRRENVRTDAAGVYSRYASPRHDDHPFFSFAEAVRAYYAKRNK
jgi:curved DNA-binding protein CbpA